jgi:hypothetical protein
MATFERVNGYLNNFLADDVMKSTSDLKAVKLTLRSTSNGSNTAIDLRDKDGDAVNEADQLVEVVIKELSPLLYVVDNAATGVIHMIVHGHNVDAAQIKARIVGISKNSATIASDTAVDIGTRITVA